MSEAKAVLDGKTVTGPDFPSWEGLEDGAEFHADPRTLLAAGFVEAALSGCGLGGLCNLIRTKPGAVGVKEVGGSGRDGVAAAYLLADEVLRQAWGDDPAAAEGPA